MFVCRAEAIVHLDRSAQRDTRLKQVAVALQSTLRSIDIIGRLGGEEFAILLPSIDVQGAELVAERLLRTAAYLTPTFEGQPIRVTISIGCAEMSGAVADLDGLLREADAALYAAKQGGRNKVAVQPAAAA